MGSPLTMDAWKRLSLDAILVKFSININIVIVQLEKHNARSANLDATHMKTARQKIEK